MVSIQLEANIKRTKNNTVQLDVAVKQATGISEAVFAIEVLPRSADKCAPLYRFSHVCSPSEMVEFPDTVPGDNCYFRISEMTMLFDTSTIAEKTLNCLKKDIKHLVNEMNALEDAAVVSETVTF